MGETNSVVDTFDHISEFLGSCTEMSITPAAFGFLNAWAGHMFDDRDSGVWEPHGNSGIIGCVRMLSEGNFVAVKRRGEHGAALRRRAAVCAAMSLAVTAAVVLFADNHKESGGTSRAEMEAEVSSTGRSTIGTPLSYWGKGAPRWWSEFPIASLSSPTNVTQLAAQHLPSSAQLAHQNSVETPFLSDKSSPVLEPRDARKHKDDVEAAQHPSRSSHSQGNIYIDKASVRIFVGSRAAAQQRLMAKQARQTKLFVFNKEADKEDMPFRNGEYVHQHSWDLDGLHKRWDTDVFSSSADASVARNGGDWREAPWWRRVRVVPNDRDSGEDPQKAPPSSSYRSYYDEEAIQDRLAKKPWERRSWSRQRARRRRPESEQATRSSTTGGGKWIVWPSAISEPTSSGLFGLMPQQDGLFGEEGAASEQEETQNESDNEAADYYFYALHQEQHQHFLERLAKQHEEEADRQVHVPTIKVNEFGKAHVQFQPREESDERQSSY